MGDYLRRQPRDIVYSLCQYGMSKVWEWGGAVGGNCWRTTGDITGTWTSMSRIALAHDEAAAWAKPGNWNDPDMLILGVIGWGNPQPTRLTPDEQYLHFSLWSLFSAPLLIGCDLEKLDDFTLSLLTNDEVIALDQDPLGQQAKCVDTVGDVRVYRKALEDGSVAVGFCNFGRQPAELSYDNLALLGFSGRQQVRDLWRQQDLGTVEIGRGPLPLKIPTHGIVLLKFVRAPSAQSRPHTSSVRPFAPGDFLGNEEKRHNAIFPRPCRRVLLRCRTPRTNRAGLSRAAAGRGCHGARRILVRPSSKRCPASR
jgi:alpha-galactosidase